MSEHIKTLTELAEGTEQAAEVEGKIWDAYQDEMARFNLRDGSANMRRVRVAVDARNNRERFEREAKALRYALAALSAQQGEGET